MKLIVGLGNPGKEYEDTRHNVGFMVVDELLKKLGSPNLKEKFNGLFCECDLQGEKLILLKPQSFINLSGEVINKYINYYDINLKDIIIINDDMDLDLGRYRLKPSGSSAGHNGLKNIEQNLKTDEYKRLKIGISSNKYIEARNYVLGKFNKDEKVILKEVINKTVEIIEDYLKLSFEELMSKYNRK
jgi:PTH1 family peptidyl-tRNA hydrolase